MALSGFGCPHYSVATFGFSDFNIEVIVEPLPYTQGGGGHLGKVSKRRPEDKVVTVRIRYKDEIWTTKKVIPDARAQKLITFVARLNRISKKLAIVTASLNTVTRLK